MRVVLFIKFGTLLEPNMYCILQVHTLHNVVHRYVRRRKQNAIHIYTEIALHIDPSVGKCLYMVRRSLFERNQ